MSTINFDFDSAYDCITKIRAVAELIEQEGSKMSSLISAVETGWTGAGAQEYIQYLVNVQKNIYERAQNLYNIANMVSGSAELAREADEEAARLAANQVCSPSASSSQAQTSYQPPASPSAESSNNPGAARPSHSSSGSGLFGAAANAIGHSKR